MGSSLLNNVQFFGELPTIPYLRIFLVVFRVPFLQSRSHHFWKAETIVHTYLAMEHVHHELLEVIVMIQQQFSSNEKKNWCRPRVLFVRFKFRYIEYNNTTLHNVHTCLISHSCASDTCWWQNLYSTNCSGAPSVVRNLHFIFVYLVQKRI